jgi:cytochrome o ubiquinol oxidase subunit 2
VNFIEFPANTPVSFELTADAPMNSFWIPQLGGQMYAMPGMETHLHLLANNTGEFAGSDAEISGAGFAGMRFIAKATSQADFDAWVQTTKQSSNILSLSAYNQLAKPSENSQKTFYSSVETGLYNGVIMKFMAPKKQMEGMQ